MVADLQSSVQERIRALNSVEAYIEWLRPEMLPDFDKVPAKHHRLFMSIIEDIAFGRSDRDAISVPPGAAKSLYFSIIGPTWMFARDPTEKHLCITASENIAEDFSRRRRQILKSERWQLLSSTSLMPDAQSLGFQGVKEGGGIYAFGAGSTIQSIRADHLWPDDLVTGLEQAGSISQLDKLWNWYLAEARTRLRKGGTETMIATRWALHDPIGRVLKLTADGHENWRYCRIPMICDEDNDPLGRAIGERLWPEWYTDQKVADAQRSPLIWNTLYQQRPAADEFGWVPAECIHIEQQAPERLTYYIGIDISLGVADGDFVVFAVVGVDEQKNFWLVDLYREKVDPAESSKKFLEYCRTYQPKYCWIEDDNASRVWHQLVMERSAGRRPPLLISKMKNRDKEDRAAPLRVLFIEGRVRLLNRPWTQLALSELAEFPGGTHDDIIDAFGVVAKETRHISAPKTEERVEMPPIVGNIQLKDGKFCTTQSFDQLFTLNAGRKRRHRI